MRRHSISLGLIALTALTTFVHCSSKSSNEERACSGAQALTAIGLRGTSMPAKTLALTFDDGPGMRTKQLSLYLKEQGIQAGFFVNGRSMGPDAPEILHQLVEDGHIIANHTETHRSLTGRATATPRLTDPEVLQEIESTDLKIEPFVIPQRLLFRPPFGDFDETTHTSLASTAMNKYIGPILWDIGDRMDEKAGQAADWDCWQDGSDAKRISVQACGDLYVLEAKRQGKGIVLLHDPYFNDLDPEQGGTVDMVMYIVPLLKAEGFNFIRVDHVPEIAALLPPDGSVPPDGGTKPKEPQSNDPKPPSETPPAENPCP